MSAPILETAGISAGLVALAEIGDRTQLLGVMLVCRYRKPLTILVGILAGTIANHLLAAALGAVLGRWLEGPWMKWVLGLSFLAFAAWSLLPEKEEGEDELAPRSGRSVLATTAVSFFLLEMGDKTQLATAVLAARFGSIAAVVAGSTLGMMLANAPSVMIGHALGERLPLKLLRLAAALVSAAVGVWTLLA